MKNPKGSNIFMLVFIGYMVLSSLFLGVYTHYIPVEGEKNKMLFLLLSQDFIVFIVPMAIYLIISGRSLDQVIPHRRLSIKNAIYVVLITFLMMPIMTLCSAITNMFVDSSITETFQDVMLDFPWWVSVIFMAIMPPLCEEAMFRGFIMTGYKRAGLAKAIFVSSLFFGMMHLNLYQLPYATIAGLFLGAMVYYTGSIYASMLAHFIVNGSQTLAFLAVTKFMPEEELKRQLETVTTLDDQIASVYASAALMIICLPFLLFLLSKFAKRNRAIAIEYSSDKSATYAFNADNAPKERVFDLFFWLTLGAYALAMCLFKN